MATGSVKSLKYTDVSLTIPASGQFVETTSGVTYANIKSAFLVYNDDVYYAPPVMAIKPNGSVCLKLQATTGTARTYTVRVFYE